MVRWILVIVLVLAARPARADNAVTAALLTAAELSLAVDCLQTLGIARARDGSHEVNPILGPHPSDGLVLSYFAATMVATAVLSRVLPERARALAPALVLAIEVPQIGRNFSVGAGIWLPF
jgi:hypothetical protein